MGFDSDSPLAFTAECAPLKSDTSVGRPSGQMVGDWSDIALTGSITDSSGS